MEVVEAEAGVAYESVYRDCHVYLGLLCHEKIVGIHCTGDWNVVKVG